MSASNRTVVTVATGKTLTVEVNGFTVTYVAGETPTVATNEVAQLRAQGLIN